MKKNNIHFQYARFLNLGTVLFCMLFILISSCRKDSLIKTGVQPEEDNLNISYIDTFTLNANSYKLDSVRSDGVSTGVFGYSLDNIFGTINATFITQIKPSGISFSTNNLNDVVIDSVIFSVLPSACYGDASKTSSFSLYQLEDSINLESNYYTFQTFNYNTTPLSTVNYSKIIYIDSLESYQTIDFKLDTAFGRDLLTQINTSIDEDEFYNLYKGFVIGANSAFFEDNLLIHADIFDNQTKMTVYYRDSITSSTLREYDFVISNTSERINLFINDYSGSDVNYVFDNITEGQEAVYLMDMSGIGINIKIPHLKNLYLNNPIIVNKAEIVVPLVENSTKELPEHYEITMGVYYNDSLLTYTKDDLFETHFTGIIQGDEYRFNITRDMQRIFDEYTTGGDVNYGYTLLSLSPEQNTNGSVFWGTKPIGTENKMKFILKYSLAK